MADIMDRVFAPDIRLTLSTGGGLVVSAVALTEHGERFMRDNYVCGKDYNAVLMHAAGLTIETAYEDEQDGGAHA